MRRYWTTSIAAASIALVLAVLGCRRAPAPDVAEEAEPRPSASGRIVLGDVSTDVGSNFRKWQPLADYLAARLADHGIGVGELRVVPDPVTMGVLLRDGEVDLYMDSFYPTHYVSLRSGAEPLLLRRKHPGTKSSVFFAKVDSGLTTLAELAGQTIAVEDHASTSGYLLPLAHLMRNGLLPVEESVPATAVAGDQVKIILSGDDDNTVRWVASGRVVAGAVDRETFDNFYRDNPNILIALDTTPEIIRHQVMLARPGMSAELRVAIATVLKAASETEDGQQFLEGIETEAFTDISEPDTAALQRAKEMYDLIASR